MDNSLEMDAQDAEERSDEVLRCENINELTDPLMKAILSRLPLIDILRAGFVCSRWNRVRDTICQERESLAIYSPFATNYGASNGRNNYRLKLDLLRFFNLDYRSFDLITEVKPDYFGYCADLAAVRRLPMVCRDQSVSALPRTLPNIQKFTIFDCALSADEVISMLLAWRETLTSLCLVIIQPQFDWPKVLRILNELASLEHLSLFCFEGALTLNDHLPRTLMSQLKTFYFAYWDYYFTMTQSYLFRAWDHLNLERLESFGLAVLSAHTNSAPFIRYNLKRLLEKKPALAGKLTRIKLPQMSRTFFQFLCAGFPSITFLDMVLTEFKNDLLPLEQTKQLQYLSIRSNTRPYSVGPLQHLTEEEMLQLPLLDTVKKLFVLDFDIRDVVLHFIFPNATVQRDARGDQNEVDCRPESANNWILIQASTSKGPSASTSI